MPELPEVETIVRQLGKVLPGNRVQRVQILRDNIVQGSPAKLTSALEGVAIRSVSRRAKFIVVELESDRVWLTHLRMSGSYRVLRSGGNGGSLPVYTRAIFDLEDGSRLLYVDPRTLGLLEIVPAAAWMARAAKLGPEPLSPAFTVAVLEDRLAHSRQPIKTFLLDQRRIAGLGNIYVAEALWRARVSPRRRAKNVGPMRAARLHCAIVEVLSEAVGESGTSLGGTYLNFADADGDPGEFYEALNVYDREDEPCRRCGEAIKRIVQAQRSTYYCSLCQR
ncbi:MAG: bifunctional DNA-formamidopyrimidine glycosylase/DNA-(apurinic or apyrimidinic site) lyase [Gemmatimonadota bacterium]|jgi:formamidopyrimidine-DNA glycosylase